ncbi:MAG: uracil-DNA glycosylase [Enterovirga sp.]|jgi:uracil-DNA glycosylase|nr:uracil-DNA glycosylase [Enterovirga sp.]
MRRDTLPEPRSAFLTSSRPVSQALATLRREASGWVRLPFFARGEADRIASELDRLCAAGVALAPQPADIFNALRLTPLDRVRVVILGQDPYPKAGDAHGLAFSYVGPRSVPASLRVILRELCDDIGCPPPLRGDLTGWAREGVLLLNTALTTETGSSGAHLRLGWSALTDQVVAAISAERPAVAFLLWGADARRRAPLVDRTKHLVIETGHPSPLNRARDFPGSRPFSRANAFLKERGAGEVEWRLGTPTASP